MKRTPAFWTRDRSLPGWLLGPVGARVGAITAARMGREGERLAVPVLCVGNFTAGGAGKTPTAVWLAGALAAQGHAPYLVSRGYGGAVETPTLVDPDRHRAAEVGDEPLLLARAAPTIVARDRVAGARLAVASGADVIVLDDGLQNPALAKTATLAVVDGASGAGNGRCVPAGPLRAPLAEQMPYVDAALVIGAGARGERVADAARAAGKPVFRARLAPDAAVAARLKGAKAIGVAGLGRPEKLRDSLIDLGAEVAGFHPLADHALPSEEQARAIVAEAARLGARIVATEKDMVKWRHERPALFAASEALPVTLAPEDAAGLLAVMTEGLKSG
ncbi:tetraacyldisaccharide 4'-kinase [Methylopila jiangsuensis]|uniref:Tetraacyldisaccharide 4'-kinase n=1 Tax=Methylopila jiangsuensis TaxID=586230 RepID=A0A9W6JKD1_9HYPH|nr:tetraacyldisaccharide 4'-kinase [Methylopila jiangsuensis]MDR6284802.1 tetraacyldisaccharide 4'-kinase [Methylopila jiangsuensis]GLK77808.1 tetraacyldisaccharide 4'-kinase [Methylopila jiangsuensis]